MWPRERGRESVAEGAREGECGGGREEKRAHGDGRMMMGGWVPRLCSARSTFHANFDALVHARNEEEAAKRQVAKCEDAVAKVVALD